MKALYAAGARLILVGIESVEIQRIKALKKEFINDVATYKETIRLIHDHGIFLLASFVLGSDFDDISIFEKTERFIREANLLFPLINIMTPLPGTQLLKTLEKENRMRHRDWKKYDFENACFIPKKMTTECLEKKRMELLRKIHSYDSLYARVSEFFQRQKIGSLRNKRFFTVKRILFCVKILLEAEGARIQFVFKSLWKNRGIPLRIIIAAISFHDHVYSQE